MRVFGSHDDQGASYVPVVTPGREDGLWGTDIGEAARLEGRRQGGGWAPQNIRSRVPRGHVGVTDGILLAGKS